MTINLKTTIVLSGLLAVFLNLGQFVSSYMHHSKDAFAPAWASASTPDPQPGTPPKLSIIKVGTTSATTASSAPTTSDAAGIAATLSATGLSPDHAALYLAVQKQTGTPWQLLAAVHKVETGQSGNTARSSYAGATGPMQFMPATFNSYAADGDGNGTKDITDIDDAMLSAGRYLAANGANRGQYGTALYQYNHSSAYVSQVTSIYHRLGL